MGGDDVLTVKFERFFLLKQLIIRMWVKIIIVMGGDDVLEVKFETYFIYLIACKSNSDADDKWKFTTKLNFKSYSVFF